MVRIFLSEFIQRKRYHKKAGARANTGVFLYLLFTSPTDSLAILHFFSARRVPRGITETARSLEGSVIQNILALVLFCLIRAALVNENYVVLGPFVREKKTWLNEAATYVRRELLV